jgi:hypothetical protein
MRLEVLSSVGKLPNTTVGAPGAQGAGVFGKQGTGVNTPSAAAVAEATIGFKIDMHMPKGMMLTKGTWSMIFASGWCCVNVLFSGSTTSELGATPKLHCIMAPMQTCIAIRLLQQSRRLIVPIQSPENHKILNVPEYFAKCPRILTRVLWHSTNCMESIA